LKLFFLSSGFAAFFCLFVNPFLLFSSAFYDKKAQGIFLIPCAFACRAYLCDIGRVRSYFRIAIAGAAGYNDVEEKTWVVRMKIDILIDKLTPCLVEVATRLEGDLYVD
jgi:hypothetical protein